MSINLIDTLLDEYPVIHPENHSIQSEIPLSNILGSETPNDNKSQYVIFANQLDQFDMERRNTEYSNSGSTYRNNYGSTSMYRDFWKRLDLLSFIISQKLLSFLLFGCDNYSIQKIFNMDTSVMRDKETTIKIFSTITKKFNYLKEGEGGYLVYGEKGSQIRFGKFINMILELMHGNSMPGIRQQEVERMVDLYKTKFSTSEYRIAVLNGDDINLGYDRRYQSRKGDTMLYQSCMNDKPEATKLYTVNPDKIYLLVILNGEGKIISRNLVWRLNKYNNFVFDRVYAIDNYIRNAAIKIAVMENWIKYEEGIGISSIQKIDYSGESKTVRNSKLRIKLNFNGVHLYPYLDTFVYQRKWGTTLTNKRLYKFRYRYHQTGGGRDSD